MELIIYPNPRIDQTLLLDSIKRYNDKCNKPVNLRILDAEIKDDAEDYYKNSWEYLKLYLEIRQAKFYCKAYQMEDGVLDKTKTVSVPASWETITFYYPLYCKNLSHGNYWIENNDALFYLLNYALQQRGKLLEGNRQGLKNVGYNVIINALKDLTFKAVVKELDGQDVILPVELEEIPINL